MDELRSSLADRMNAKNLTGILVEKKFQHPHFVPQNLTPRDFTVACDTDFIGDFMLDELSLVLADHGNLGHGINPIGNQVRPVLDGDPKSMTCGSAPLFHRRRSQTGKPDHISYGINVGQASLIMLIDRNATALVRLYADGIEPDAGCSSPPARSVEQRIAESFFPLLKVAQTFPFESFAVETTSSPR